MKRYDVIVIGGGASGMMAAAIASSQKKKVLLIEKNKNLAEKLKISGGGRCNITNAEFNPHFFLKNFGDSEKFLYSPFSIFGVEDTFTFFQGNGLPLVIEENGRTFPKSQKAYDVYKTLERILVKEEVEILSNNPVKSIGYNNGHIEYVDSLKGRLYADSYILSTGGISHPETGSTGDGFKWLKEMGHSIKKPTPTIVPLAVKEEWIKVISGVTLPQVKLSVYINGRKSFSKEGNILCTHFGMSGPFILNLAGKINDLLQEGKVTGVIDLFPKLDENILDKKILEIFDKNRKKSLKNALKELLHDGTISGISKLFDINLDKRVDEVSKDERKSIVKTIKAMPVTITNLMGKDKAVSADGGVELKEIDMKTMKSKLFDNLYITGDLLHINRPSGGYSLQLCWTTGYIAGKNA